MQILNHKHSSASMSVSLEGFEPSFLRVVTVGCIQLATEMFCPKFSIYLRQIVHQERLELSIR
jgi:hypothetical protein